MRPVDLWTNPLARASRLSAERAHLWMAGWTTLRVAHAPTHRPSAAHKLHRAPPLQVERSKTKKTGVQKPSKTAFKLFNFFATCEYFETEFNYDEVLKLPRPQGKGGENGDGTGPVVVGGTYEHLGADILASMRVEQITSWRQGCVDWRVVAGPHRYGTDATDRQWTT
jgi:hypothetical protein